MKHVQSPDTKLIGKWFDEEFKTLSKSIPLKERYDIAADLVIQRIDEYKKIIDMMPKPPFVRIGFAVFL